MFVKFSFKYLIKFRCQLCSSRHNSLPKFLYWTVRGHLSLRHLSYCSCYLPNFDKTWNLAFLDPLLHKSWWHLSRKHLIWQQLSISAISQLFLHKCWPTFKGRFLGPYLTDAKCHGTFVQATFVLMTLVHGNNTRAFTDPKNLLDPKLFWTPNLFGPKFFRSKFFSTQTFFYLNFFGPKICWTQIFSWQNFLYQTFFFTTFFYLRFLDKNIFWTQRSCCILSSCPHLRICTLRKGLSGANLVQRWPWA